MSAWLNIALLRNIFVSVLPCTSRPDCIEAPASEEVLGGGRVRRVERTTCMGVSPCKYVHGFCPLNSNRNGRCAVGLASDRKAKAVACMAGNREDAVSGLGKVQILLGCLGRLNL